jgi:hypothetical protein
MCLGAILFEKAVATIWNIALTQKVFLGILGQIADIPICEDNYSFTIGEFAHDYFIAAHFHGTKPEFRLKTWNNFFANKTEEESMQYLLDFLPIEKKRKKKEKRRKQRKQWKQRKQ